MYYLEEEMLGNSFFFAESNLDQKKDLFVIAAIVFVIKDR